MHVLLLTDNFPPETNAPANRCWEHAREWVAEGHAVTVITCAPNFPAGRVHDGYKNRLWQVETSEGIRVIRVWSYITRNEGFVKRILDYQSFMITAFIASLFVRGADVIIGTSPQFFTGCAAWAASVLKRRPFVLELRDLWPESIRAVGAMRESRALDFLEKVELFLYRRATHIVVVTKAFRDNLTRRGIDSGKISIVRNGVDLSRFRPLARDATLAHELGFNDKFVVGYIGTHGMAHALDTVLDAAALIQHDPIGDRVRFLFLGDGAEKARLRARAAEMGLANVVFVDTVPRDQVPRYWSLADAALIHLRRTDLFKTVIPSKLFECMAMGVPVLHGVDGESAEIVNETGVGEVFRSEDPEAMVAALRRQMEDASLRARFAVSGPQAALKFDRKVLARDLLAVLTRVVRVETSAMRGAQ